MRNIITFCLAYNLALLRPAESTRFLLVGTQGFSHMNKLTSLGEDLIKRGNEVYALVGQGSETAERSLKQGMKMVLFDTPGGQHEFSSYEISRKFSEIIFSGGNRLEAGKIAFPIINRDCETILSAKFIEKLKSLKFDYAIVDQFILAPCLFLLPRQLNIPFICVSENFEPWAGGSPTLPSFCPLTGLLHFTDRMTFVERTINLLAHAAFSLFLDYAPFRSNTTLLRKYAPEVSNWDDLVKPALLFIVTREQTLEWPRPTMPNVIVVPGMSVERPKPLSDVWNTLATSSGPHGLIVFSFGSVVSYMPPELVEKFFRAFATFKQTIVWRYPTDKEDVSKFSLQVPANVHLAPWIPQNDLLANPNTRLFITHCGNNGQYEAVYNGVPMIGFPLFAEQVYNGFRIEAHGYGLVMDILNFSSDELRANIDRILGESSFKDKVRHASNILRHSPMMPREIAGHWVEHVVKFGSEHLRSRAMELPWYQYFMIDSIALLLGILLAFLYLLKLIGRSVWKCARGSGKKNETKAKGD